MQLLFFLALTGIISGSLSGIYANGSRGLLIGGMSGLIAGAGIWLVTGIISRTIREYRLDRYFSQESEE